MTTVAQRDALIDKVQLNVNPVVTSLVLGTPRRRTMPGMRLLRPITVDAVNFQYVTFDNAHLQDVDAERAMRAEITTVDWDATTDTGKLLRYTKAVKKDKDEIRNAHPSLRIQELSALLARRTVELNMERKIHSVVTDATPGNSYASGHIFALTNGFDDPVNGDSKTAIRTAAATIAADTGAQIGELSVFLPESSFNAAVDDPLFLEKRGNFSTVLPTAADLAAFWGVKEVWTANPVVKSGTGIAPLYGDIAVVYFDGVGQDFDTEYGELVWGASFKLNGGVALEPWYDPKTTCWWFPWEDFLLPQITNPKAAALLTNCKD
jgi:hypothetical protein